MKEYSFMGKFKHKIDKKGRVAIPMDFYKQLDEKLLFLTKLSIDETPMIAIFPTKELLISELIKFYGFDVEDKKNRQIFLADSYSREIDCARRINLNNFDVFSGDEVIVIGNLDSFEIWDIASYEEHSQKVKKYNI